MWRSWDCGGGGGGAGGGGDVVLEPVGPEAATHLTALLPAAPQPDSARRRQQDGPR